MHTSSLQCFRYSPTPRGISDLYGTLQPSEPTTVGLLAHQASGINASGNHIQHISPNVMFLLWLTYHVLTAQHFRFLLFSQLFVAFCLFLLCWYYPKTLLISGCGVWKINYLRILFWNMKSISNWPWEQWLCGKTRGVESGRRGSIPGWGTHNFFFVLTVFTSIKTQLNLSQYYHLSYSHEKRWFCV
jgi:hypothetical protein